jgi:hypothetical protein
MGQLPAILFLIGSISFAIASALVLRKISARAEVHVAEAVHAVGERKPGNAPLPLLIVNP